MALLDRFRRPPQWKSDDPLARISGVEELPLDQQDLLISIAHEDPDARVRRAAVRKIIDPGAVAEVARTDRDENVRDEAAGILRDLALGVFENTTESECLAALALIQDAGVLMTVAESASLESVWRTAIARLEDQKSLGTVARRASLPAARLEALARLEDPAEIAAVAMKTEHKDVAVAAVERIAERDVLKAVAAKAAAKAASRRARSMVEALEAADRPPVEVPTPEALAAQAAARRRGDLCRQVELSAKGGAAVSELTERLRRAEDAWTQMTDEPDAELTQRFATACRAAEETIARLAAAEAEQRRVADETAAALAERTALSERVQAIDGDDALVKLEEARAAWRSLPALPAGQEGAAEAAARRFGEAVAACERRYARAQAARALNERAERACREAEEVAATARFPDASARWVAVARAWKDMVASGFTAEDLTTRFSQAEERFRAREQQAREQQARQRQANLERLQRQAGRVEALLAAPALSLKDTERALSELRTAIDDMPILPQKQDHDDMVRRMEQLHAALVPKVQELREIDEWQQWANAGVQERLCQRAEALAEVSDVAEVARQLREIQEEWKKASHVPREKSQALWARFKAAADQARARLDTYFAQQAEERGSNLARKLALCQQAEALADSTDWIKTAEAMKALQSEWKSVGPVPRGQEQAIWERFRQACDRFFTRRHEDLVHRKEEWAANLARKQALCERVEALAASTEWEQGISELKRAQAEWKTIGPVRKNRAEAIWQRFRTACDAYFERYRDRDNAKLAAEQAERETLIAELEALVGPPLDGSDTPGAEGTPPENLVDRVVRNRSRWLELEHGDSARRSSWAPLNERYKAALVRVLEAHGTLFSETALDPEAARRSMVELCERVERVLMHVRPISDPADAPAAVLARQLREALAANTIGGRPSAAEVEERWRAADEEIRAARALWHSLGPVPGETGRSLARRFQHACRRIAEQRDREMRTSYRAEGPATSPRSGSAAVRRPR